MKALLLIPAILFMHIGSGWNTDFEKAKQEAKRDHKYILLNFSGSDWCGPCIRMHKEIFESPVFISYSEQSLVLVNADFPRLSKNHLSKEQQKQNDRLADQYDPAGNFPFTVLLDADGKVLTSWQGYPPLSPEKFVDQVKNAINAHQ